MECETDLTDQQKDQIENSDIVAVVLPNTLEVFLKAETKDYQNDKGILQN